MCKHEEQLIEVCQQVFTALEKMNPPPESMRELAEALYLLRAVVRQIHICERNLRLVKDQH